MDTHTINASEIQKQAELAAQDQIAGAGAEAQYIAANDDGAYPIDELNGTDSVQMTSSSTPSAPNLDAAANGAKVKINQNPMTDEENYVENSSEYRDAIDGGNGSTEETSGSYGKSTYALKGEDTENPPPPPPPNDGNDGGVTGSGNVGGSNGSDGDYGFEDAFGNIDQGLDDAFSGWDEGDFINEGGDGDYDTLNEEALEAFMEKVLKHLNKLLGLAMAATLGSDIRDVVDEILSGLPLEKDDTKGLKAAIMRSFTHTMKAVQQGFSKLLEKVNKHNQEVYKEKMENMQNKANSTGFKVENWWKGGHPAEKLNRDMAKEQERYLQALDKNVKAFKALIQLMIQLISEGMVEGEKTNDILLGITNGLKQTVGKIDEFSKQIDDKLEETRQYLEEMESIDSCEKGWGMFWDGITEGDWSKIWGGLKGALRAAQDWLEEIPVINVISSLILEPVQQGLSVIENPVEFCLTFIENFLDMIAVALDKIGEFIDKLIYTIAYGLFGWIGLAVNGEWGVGDWGAGDGDFVSTWKDWDGYGTHGVGDIVQWVGKFVVDEIIDNIILDNLIDGIRFVLYEGVSRVWNGMFGNKWGGYNPLDDPGTHDYFGVENISLFGYDGVSYSSDGKVVKWDTSSSIYTPDAFQDLALDQLIKDLRGGIIKHQNAYRIALSMMLVKSDIRRAVFRELTGLNGVKGNGDLLVKGSEILAGPTTQILDGALSAVMLRTSVYNQHLLTVDALQKLEAARAAQAAAVLTTIATLVLAVLLAIATWGTGTPAAAALVAVQTELAIATAVCGVGSAVANASAQKILADIDPFDVQEPAVETYSDPEFVDAGGAVEDVLHNIDQEIAALDKALAKGDQYMVQTQDGMYHLDYKALANLERRLNTLNNAIRTIFYMAKSKQDLRRLVQAMLKGVAGDSSTEGLTMSALENMLAQRQVLVSGITFQLQQVVAARNMARQREIAMANSTAGASGQAAGAVLSLVAACIPGLQALGAILNIATALTSSAIGIASALGSEGNALGMTYNSNDRQLDQYLEHRAQTDEGFESKLDRLEAEAMMELMENGIVGTGDGYHNVNYSLLAQTYNRIQKIYQMKQILSDVLSMNAKVRSVVQRQLTGVSPTSTDDLTKAVNQANLSTALRVANKISSHLKTTATVMNQARDAEKNLKMQAITGAVNIAVSSLSITGLATLEPTSWAFKLCEAAAPLMSVTNSLTSLVLSSVSASSDQGFYTNYNVNDTVDKMDDNQISKGKSWEERLDEKEYEIMRQMEADLISSMDCAMVGVSADTAGISNSLNKLHNMRLAIAEAMQIMQSIKSAMGHYTPGTSIAQIIEGNRSASMSVMGALRGALDAVAERENQITQAKMQAIASAVNLAFSMAVLGCTVGRIDAQHKIDVAGKTNNAAGHNIGKLESSVKALRKAAAALSFIGGVVSSLIPALYDAAYQDGASDKAINKTDEAKEKDKGEGKGKDKAEAKGDGGGYAASMDRMDAEIAAADYNLTQYEAQHAAIAYRSANAESAAQFLKNLPLQVVNLVTELFAPQKGVAPGHDPDAAKASDPAKAHEMAGAATAGATEAVKPAEQKSETKVDKADSNSPSSKAALEYFDKLVADRDVLISKQAEATDNNIALLEESVKEQEEKGVKVAPQVAKEIEQLKKKQESDLIEAGKKAKTHQVASKKVEQLSQKQMERQAELEDLNKQLEQKKDALQQLESAKKNGKLAPEQKAKLENDIAKLKTDIAKLEARIKALTAKINSAAPELAAAQGEKAKIEGEIAALAQEIGSLEQMSSQAVRAQVANLDAEMGKIEKKQKTRETELAAVVKSHGEESANAANAKKLAAALSPSLETKKAKFKLEAEKLLPHTKQARLKEIKDLEAKLEVSKAEEKRAKKAVVELEAKKTELETEIKGLKQTLAHLNKLKKRLEAALPKAQEKEQKAKVKAADTGAEPLKAAAQQFVDDVQQVSKTKAQQEEIIASSLRNKDVRTAAKMLTAHKRSAEETADIIIGVANDPKQGREKAQKIYQLVRARKGDDYLKKHEARITAALSAPAQAPAANAPAQKPVENTRPSSQVYSDWEKQILSGNKTVQDVAQTAQKATELESASASALKQANSGSRTKATKQQLEALKANLIKERKELVKKYNAFIKEVGPTSKKAAQVKAGAAAEIDKIKARQEEISKMTPAQRKGKEAALDKEMKNLQKLRSAFEDIKGKLSDMQIKQLKQVMTAAKNNIASLDSQIRAIGRQIDIAAMEELSGSASKPVEAKNKPSSSKKSASSTGSGSASSEAKEELEEEKIGAVEDTANKGQKNGNFLSWLFGDSGSGKATEAEPKRVMAQVGNIAGENVQDQYARVMKEKVGV